jgi:hypothetical protein
MQEVRRPFLALLLVLAVRAATLVLAAGPYHGNVESRIFHQSTCRYYNCEKCTKVFETREAAIDAGYRPCKVCEP